MPWSLHFWKSTLPDLYFTKSFGDQVPLTWEFSSYLKSQAKSNTIAFFIFFFYFCAACTYPSTWIFYCKWTKTGSLCTPEDWSKEPVIRYWFHVDFLRVCIFGLEAYQSGVRASWSSHRGAKCGSTRLFQIRSYGGNRYFTDYFFINSQLSDGRITTATPNAQILFFRVPLSYWNCSYFERRLLPPRLHFNREW